MDRLSLLKDLVGQNPQDAFSRYGLAMEYSKAGAYADAVSEFVVLIGLSPDYVAAYYQGGQVLEKLGRREEAKAMYLNGIQAAGRTSNTHARDELEAALQNIS